MWAAAAAFSIMRRRRLLLLRESAFSCGHQYFVRVLLLCLLLEKTHVIDYYRAHTPYDCGDDWLWPAGFYSHSVLLRISKRARKLAIVICVEWHGMLQICFLWEIRSRHLTSVPLGCASGPVRILYCLSKHYISISEIVLPVCIVCPVFRTLTRAVKRENA